MQQDSRGLSSVVSAWGRFLCLALLLVVCVGGVSAQFTPSDAGTEIWSYNYGGTVYGVSVDSDGNVYAGGFQDSVVKLDSSGNEVWSYNYGDSV